MPRYKELAPMRQIGDQQFRPGLVTYEFLYDGQEYFHQVQPGEQHRLDLISQRFYGNSDFYWIIAAHNRIKDTFSVEVGDLLRIPVDVDEVFRLLEGQWN